MVWLQKIATGSLKWTPEYFETALIPDILLAYEGHIDELKMIYGTDDKKQADKVTVTSAEDFASLFGKRL